MRDTGGIAVVLTHFHAADAPVMAKGDEDPELRRWFEVPPDFKPSIGHSEEVVSRWQGERAAGVRLTFAVRDALSGELLGGCELRPQESGVGDLSYWTYPAHRRKGVATRAVCLLSDLAFDQMGLSTLELAVDADNTASRRVAAAAGFTLIGEQGGKLLSVLQRSGSVPPD